MILGSFFWSLSGGLVSRSAVLTLTLVAVRAFTPEDFALYTAMLAIVLLAASVWDFGLSVLVTREYAGDRLPTLDTVQKGVWFRLRTLPLWILSFGIGVALVHGDNGFSLHTLAAFAADSLLLGAQTIPLAMLRARFRFRWSETAIAGGRWLSSIIALLALPSVGIGAGLFFFASALVAGDALTLAVAILGVARLPQKRDIDTSANRATFTVRAAAPFAANGLLASAYNRLDVLLVAGLSSLSQLSLYAPASRIQDALYILPGSIGAVALPMMSKAWSKTNGRDNVARLIRIFISTGLAMALPVTVFIYLFTPQLLGLVLGPDYAAASTQTRILVWFLPFGVVGAPLLAALAATGHAMDTTRVFAITFGAAMLGHLSLDWHFGATGGAIASLLRDPCAIALALVLAKRAGLLNRDHHGLACSSALPASARK